MDLGSLRINDPEAHVLVVLSAQDQCQPARGDELDPHQVRSDARAQVDGSRRTNELRSSGILVVECIEVGSPQLVELTTEVRDHQLPVRTAATAPWIRAVPSRTTIELQELEVRADRLAVRIEHQRVQLEPLVEHDLSEVRDRAWLGAHLQQLASM